MLSNNSIFQDIELSSSSENKPFIELYHELYEWLSIEISKATQLNKKILIILGDYHYKKESLLTGSLLLRIVKEKFDINNFLIEIGKESLRLAVNPWILSSELKFLRQNGKYITRFSANFLCMNISSCELPEDELIPLLEKNKFELNNNVDSVRENHMVNVALLQQEHTIIMVGAKHLKSFFDNLPLQDQFHIIGINSLPFSLTNEAVYSAVKLIGFFVDYNENLILKERINFLNNQNKIKQIQNKIDTDNMTPEFIIKIVKNLNLDQQPTPTSHIHQNKQCILF